MFFPSRIGPPPATRRTGFPQVCASIQKNVFLAMFDLLSTSLFTLKEVRGTNYEVRILTSYLVTRTFFNRVSMFRSRIARCLRYYDSGVRRVTGRLENPGMQPGVQNDRSHPLPRK